MGRKREQAPINLYKTIFEEVLRRLVFTATKRAQNLRREAKYYWQTNPERNQELKARANRYGRLAEDLVELLDPDALVYSNRLYQPIHGVKGHTCGAECRYWEPPLDPDELGVPKPSKKRAKPKASKVVHTAGHSLQQTLAQRQPQHTVPVDGYDEDQGRLIEEVKSTT